jgi:hypothetical protein
MNAPVPHLFGALEARALRAAQEAFIAGASGIEPPDVVARLTTVFADAKPVTRVLVRALAWWLELSPLPRRLRRFSSLALADRIAWLDRLRGASGGGVARTVYSVLKVLVQTVVYDDPAVLRSLGLAGHPAPEPPRP